MTPETSRFLRKARKHLERAQIMVGVHLYEDAILDTHIYTHKHPYVQAHGGHWKPVFERQRR